MDMVTPLAPPGTLPATEPPSSAPDEPVLEVRDLHVHLVTRRATIRAVNGVSFAVRAGETLGLVGESGSGKSMTCLGLIRLTPRHAAVGGQVLLAGDDLMTKSEAEMAQVRGRRIAMILQDPMSSLNPVFSIGMQLREAVNLASGLRGPGLRQRAVDLLKAVGITAPAARLRAFPHQLSGGMRQRVVGAMAIAGEPRVLIADEPTTSLDVTIQAQYLRLLRQLRAAHNLAIVFVTHDLGIVARMCDRVAVMYAGQIVEIAATHDLWTAPAHPYTRALLDSMPKLHGGRQRLTPIDGQPPDVAAMPKGCPFHPRCPEALPRCSREAPPQVTIAPGHAVRCWLSTPHVTAV